MYIAPLPRFSNVNWLNFHNNYCNSETISNYSTMLIGDSMITGLTRFTNIWKKYFRSLNAINSGVSGDKLKIFHNGVIIYRHPFISKAK